VLPMLPMFIPQVPRIDGAENQARNHNTGNCKSKFRLQGRRQVILDREFLPGA
jgi:hypothetical protein